MPSGADPGFQVRGGALKENVGVFRVKNHDFTPKNHFFSNFRGGARRVRPPPLDPPLALIKRVSVTYKCFEMYAHRGKKLQLLVFWDRSKNGRHLINYRHCLRSLPNRHFLNGGLREIIPFTNTVVLFFIRTLTSKTNPLTRPDFIDWLIDVFGV